MALTANDFQVIGKYELNYLDDVLVHKSVYGFLERNRGLEPAFNEVGWVKLLTILVDGLGFYRITNESNVIATASSEGYADYNGNVAEDNRAGYPIKGVSSKWTLYRIRFDRATQLKFDDVDLTLAGLTRMVGPTLDEFFRVQVVPERDAVYTSIIADCTNTSLGNRVAETIASGTAYSQLLAGEKWLFNHGVSAADTVILMSFDCYQTLLLSTQVQRFIGVQNYAFGRDSEGKEVVLSIPSFNGKPIILLPNDRDFTDVKLTNNGYTTSSLSRKINFMFVSKDYLYPIDRINKLSMYGNDVIYTFDGIIANFHLWYDLIVPVQKRVAIYASVAESLIGEDKLEVAISSVAGPESGETIINAIYTEPKGLNYAKVYVKTTDFGAIGTTQAGGTLVEVGSPFTPADDDLYVAITDASGVILAKSPSAIKVVVAE